jgi:hypothetical protein
LHSRVHLLYRSKHPSLDQPVYLSFQIHKKFLWAIKNIMISSYFYNCMTYSLKDVICFQFPTAASYNLTH